MRTRRINAGVERGYRSRSRGGMMDRMSRRSFAMIKQACFVMMASVTMLSAGWFCADANAQTLTLGQYQHPKGEKDLNFNRPYLEGIKDALIAYNMSVEDKSFCLGGMPPTLSFEQASDTLLLWARKRKGDAAGLPLGLAMLYSLKEAFPCKGTAR
jgi:hypothetical protein